MTESDANVDTSTERHRDEPSPVGERSRGERRSPAVGIAIGIVALLVVAAAAVAYWLDSAPGGMPAETVVTVKKGDSFRSVAGELQQHGLIRSAAFLDLVSVVHGTASDLQVGRYGIDAGMTTLAIHDMMVSGKQILVRSTIPEGWTLKQIANRLDSERIVSSDAFLAAASSPDLMKQLGVPADNAEGFLFPDTYLFPEGYPADKVVGTMVDAFFKNLGEVEPDYRSLSADQLMQKVTMASIVEREYRVPSEASIIASVFYNRLKDNMRLESCATVSYVLTDIEGLPHQTRLYDKDLWVDSAYNTYRHRGLPPGPISNPGRTALAAAFSPSQTSYLYFVLEDPTTGKHFFSETYSAHEMAKFQYLSLYLKQN